MSTIVAISTAPAIGGIGIIRLSGEKTFEIIEKIFVPKNRQKIEEIKGNSIKYGHIVDDGKTIDEVLVSYFKAPRSYTTENMCEINSHGGILIVRKILEICLKNGAILAEPGEFTKRAFLNGRIDLAQAESVIDIINAKSNKEVEASVKQLEGFLSNEISNIRKKIIDLMVDIEASIDYPEYDVEEVTYLNAINILEDVQNHLEKLSNSFENGKIIKEGINLAIIGRPNAGKSSLLNEFLKEERAIVTDIEGTTRDTIEEQIIISGIPFKIIDTAGIRESEDKIEKIGIEKSKKAAQDSDIILAIFDVSRALDKEDFEIIKFIKNKKAIIILNKIDLSENADTIAELSNLGKDIIKISVLERKGIEQIYKKLTAMFNINEISLDNGNIITNIRHKQLIDCAKQNAKEAICALKSNLPVDIIAINIKEILENLGKITGESVSEDIIKEIFSKFCLGK
ncbi:MAG: tRNA uridine-5-carboxymethylaminomethyl(34) synthesis GTPase MnmE [Clostridia bacterium]